MRHIFREKREYTRQTGSPVPLAKGAALAKRVNVGDEETTVQIQKLKEKYDTYKVSRLV